MKNLIIAIDQSTSATKAMLFNERCEMLKRVNVTHEQYYPRTGWVEHDVEEIYRNVLKSIAELIEEETADNMYSLAITNQRETVVVWNKHTGKPVYNAVVWQCMRGADICNDLKNRGYSEFVQVRSGLLLDPYFSASGVKWILDNVEGARRVSGRYRVLCVRGTGSIKKADLRLHPPGCAAAGYERLRALRSGAGAHLCADSVSQLYGR